VRRPDVPSVLALLPAALLVIACALASSSADAASPRTPAQLLRAFAPVLVLHPSERFQPESVDGFLQDSDLVGGRYYDQRLCRSVDGPVALDCYAQADAAHALPPLVYAASFKAGKRIVLEYWLFYPFDLYSPTDPPGEFWQDHEGDWEAVAVVLDASRKPLLVGTSRHCAGARRDWARVKRRGTHPLVYVALGSHGNYFAPGEYPHDRRCWPKVALAIFQAYGVPVNDHVAAGRTVVPSVAPVTARTPAWMAFPGKWGETQYAHFPNNDPFAFGLGPNGPAFHALWRKPLATVLAWPRG
jgi:hypothetical protein